MYNLIWNYDFGCCLLSQFILILLSCCCCCCCSCWFFFSFHFIFNRFLHIYYYVILSFLASNNVILLGKFITNCNKLALQPATSSVDRQAKLTAQIYRWVREKGTCKISCGPKKKTRCTYDKFKETNIYLIIHFVHNFHFSLACLLMHCWRTLSQHLSIWLQNVLFFYWLFQSSAALPFITTVFHIFQTYLEVHKCNIILFVFSSVT